MDYFEEFNKQNKISENIFDKIFGNKKSNENSEVYFYNNLFYFAGRSTAKKVNNPPLEFLEQFDWNSSKLNFVVSPATLFNADLINFDLKNEEITYFDGIWKSGSFIGQKFKGIFEGNDKSFFQGSFFGKYDDYKAPVFTFFEGTFFDMTNKGILGIPNTLSIDNGKVFEFISIPAGYTLQFRTQNGINSSIKVLKRLDKDSSLFKYEVLDGFKGDKSPRLILLEWQHMRQNWNKGIYSIGENSNNIGGLILIPQGDKIVEMYISTSQSTFTSPGSIASGAPEFIPGQLYKFDLSRIPQLNIKKLRGNNGQFLGNSNTDVYFSFASDVEFNNFQSMIKYLTGYVFSQDIKDIERAIRYGEIDGYGPFVYLNSLFNGVQGKKIYNIISESKKSSGRLSPDVKIGSKNKIHKAQKELKPSDKGDKNIRSINTLENSLRRLNDFVKYFVDNIVTKKGQSYDAVKQLIFSRLKEILGTSKLHNTSQVVNPTQSVQGIPNNTTSGDASQFTQGMGM